MSFLFATSHLPAVKRPQVEEEEEANAQPMQRSGGVRAISHLEEPGRGGPAVPLSQRGAQPLGRLVQTEKPAGAGTPPADGVAAAKASGIFDVVRHQYNLGGNEHFMDEHGQLQRRNESRSQTITSPAAERPSWADESEVHADHEHDPDGDADDGHSHHEVEDHRPWYLPPITHEDLHPHDGDHADSWADRPPPTRPDSSTAASGHAFEGRSTPVAFLTQEGMGGGRPSPQQSLQGSQRAIAAQQQARGASPPAQGNRLAAQPQSPAQAQPPATGPEQKGPAAPQPPAVGGAMQQNQGTDSTKQGAAPTPAKDGRDPLNILSEKFAAYPNVVESLQGLNKVPTGRQMIEKLATVADKINVGRSLLDKTYVDANGAVRVKPGPITSDTLGHEFQHLGEKFFGTANPFLHVEHPADASAYPSTGNMDKEFRAMRIQNQLLLERAKIMGIKPIFFPKYYFDKDTPLLIPGTLLPLPPPPLPPQGKPKPQPLP